MEHNVESWNRFDFREFVSPLAFDPQVDDPFLGFFLLGGVSVHFFFRFFFFSFRGAFGGFLLLLLFLFFFVFIIVVFISDGFHVGNFFIDQGHS